MVAALSVWIKNIIFVVLFASFLELLLPNSSMQRFIRVIMGLFIMLAILNPVLELVNREWRDQDITVLSTADSHISQRANEVISQRDQLARETFKRDLARQIKATVISLEGVGDASVVVDIMTDKMNLADVHLTIYIQPNTEESKIEKVRIGANEQAGEELNSSVKRKIERTIMELYGLKEKQLEIKLWR